MKRSTAVLGVFLLLFSSGSGTVESLANNPTRKCLDGRPGRTRVVVLDGFLEQADVDGLIAQLDHLQTRRAVSQGVCTIHGHERDCFVNVSASLASRMRIALDTALHVEPKKAKSAHEQRVLPARIAHGPQAEHRDRAWGQDRIPEVVSQLGHLRDTNRVFEDENTYTVVVYLGGDGAMVLGSGDDAQEVQVVPGRLIAFPNHRLLHSAYGTTRQMLGPVAYIPGRHDASLWPTGDSNPACVYSIPTTSASCPSNYEAILSQAACATAAQALASWSGTSSLFSTSTGCADTSTGPCGATGQWPTGVSGARVCVLDTGSGSASLAPWLYDDSAVPAQRIICIASGCATPTTMPMPEGCQWVLGDVTSTQDSCDDVCSVLGKACRQAELDTLEAAYQAAPNSRNYELIKNTFAAAGFSPQSVSEDCELNVNQCVQWGMPARHSTLPTCMAGVPFASCGQVFPRPSVQHLSCCARWETSAHGGNFSETPQLTECDGRRQLIFNIAACVRAACHHRHQIPPQPPSFLLPPQRLQLAQHRHLLTQHLLPPQQLQLVQHQHLSGSRMGQIQLAA